ncbi:MAG: ATP-binding protein [Chloroflexota bacterium]
MVISVASGKGGTGKTLVATSLALALADSRKVQLLDCDVEEPNDHIFVNATMERSEPVLIPVPVVNEDECNHCGTCADVCAFNAIAVVGEQVLTFPQLCHGCGACSYLCPQGAISERGREVGVVARGEADGLYVSYGKLTVGEALAPPVIKQVKEHVLHDATVIIDVPPGTSCPVVEAVRDSDLCLLVTEPTPFGLNDLVLAVETVRKLGIPSGVVLNRTGIGDAGVEDYCAREGIPVLLRIPLSTDIARLYSKGTALVEGLPEWKDSFVRLYGDIEKRAHERDRSAKR